MQVVFPVADAWMVECTSCASPDAPAGIVGRRFPAHVPGAVHLDLERAGVIPPVDHGDGEMRQAWVGHADWTWRGAFEVAAETLAAERVELVFGSIDTVARVEVNGVHVGDAANQFTTQRFDAKEALRPGRNEVSVAVRAPVPYVLATEAQLGPRPVNGDWTPYPFVRKSACNFGWDWGPRVPTSGLGGSVRIEAWRAARIESVRPLVLRCDEASATVAVHVDAVRAARGGLPVVAEVELETPLGERITGSAPLEADGRATVTLEVPRPMRWWPRGRGAQHLHGLRVRLAVEGVRGGAGVLHAWRRRIGLRSVALDTAPDAHGSRFAIVVNGEHVAVVGANWIPAQLFPEAPDGGRTDALLELACEANLNMLRVWGGGIYEPERFYERCDELGLMVWQDFMFACASYPEDDPMPALVEREAREQVARLSSHPCVVLWCGGNEDVLAWQSWGFRERLRPGQSWGWQYWSDLLPRVCREVDPTRPFWTESPWSGTLDRHANDPDHGDRHTWDLKIDAYRTMVPRFTSEFGHQSPPNLRTIEEALGRGALTMDSPDLAARQRAWGGDAAQYAPYLAEWFRPARDFGEWLYQAQLLQARAMRTCIAWLRANRPRSMGSLFWQWNDVWSGHSWSAVDVKLRPKPFWHALRECAAARLATIEPLGPAGSDGDRALRVALVNDSRDPWRAHVRVMRIGLDGRAIARGEDRVDVAGDAVDASIDPLRLVGAPSDPGAECLLAEVDGHRAWWWWRRDVERAPAAARVETNVSGFGADWTVHVRANGLVRDLWIEPDADWVRCEPNLLTLLPGEDVRVAITLARPHAGPLDVRVHWA